MAEIFRLLALKDIQDGRKARPTAAPITFRKLKPRESRYKDFFASLSLRSGSLDRDLNKSNIVSYSPGDPAARADNPLKNITNAAPKYNVRQRMDERTKTSPELSSVEMAKQEDDTTVSEAPKERTGKIMGLDSWRHKKVGSSSKAWTHASLPGGFHQHWM